MIELELKLQVPAAVADSLRAELRRRGARVVPLAAVYYDTAAFDLARHKTAVRVRREGRRWVQTLKTQGRSEVERGEVNVPLRPGAARASAEAPPLAPDAFAGTAPGAALRDLLAACADPRLTPRYTTDVRRLACELVLPGARVEAAFDEGAIVAGTRRAPLHELELELKAGDVRALCALAASWVDHGGLWLDTRSKSARGVQLARGDAAGPVMKARAPAVDASQNGPAFVRAVVRTTLDQVLANASEIAAGHGSEDHVHQARVGLRRLRTALRELGTLDLETIQPGWQAPLAETFAHLGAARDAVTAARAARPLLERAHAPKVTWDAAAPVDPGAAVRSAAFQRVLIEMLGYALAEPPATGAAPDEVRAHVVARLARLHRRVVKAAHDFAQRSFEAQHTVRKRLKRLRYLTEFVAPLFPAKRVRAYLAQLEPAQDALGAHVDIEVAMKKFRTDAAGDTQALFAAGYLEAHLADTARTAQDALKNVARARPFWKA